MTTQYTVVLMISVPADSAQEARVEAAKALGVIARTEPKLLTPGVALVMRETPWQRQRNLLHAKRKP